MRMTRMCMALAAVMLALCTASQSGRAQSPTAWPAEMQELYVDLKEVREELDYSPCPEDVESEPQNTDCQRQVADYRKRVDNMLGRVQGAGEAFADESPAYAALKDDVLSEGNELVRECTLFMQGS